MPKEKGQAAEMAEKDQTVTNSDMSTPDEIVGIEAGEDRRKIIA